MHGRAVSGRRVGRSIHSTYRDRLNFVDIITGEGCTVLVTAVIARKRTVWLKRSSGRYRDGWRPRRLSGARRAYSEARIVRHSGVKLTTRYEPEAMQ